MARGPIRNYIKYVLLTLRTVFPMARGPTRNYMKYVLSTVEYLQHCPPGGRAFMMERIPDKFGDHHVARKAKLGVFTYDNITFLPGIRSSRWLQLRHPILISNLVRGCGKRCSDPPSPLFSGLKSVGRILSLIRESNHKMSYLYNRYYIFGHVSFQRWPFLHMWCSHLLWFHIRHWECMWKHKKCEPGTT